MDDEFTPDQLLTNLVAGTRTRGRELKQYEALGVRSLHRLRSGGARSTPQRLRSLTCSPRRSCEFPARRTLGASCDRGRIVSSTGPPDRPSRRCGGRGRRAHRRRRPRGRAGEEACRHRASTFGTTMMPGLAIRTCMRPFSAGAVPFEDIQNDGDLWSACAAPSMRATPAGRRDDDARSGGPVIARR